jgi:integrase/recombinase XerD
MERMRAPAVEEAATPIPDPDALRRLLAVCAGKGFDERRDWALILLAADTGLRRGELAALTLDDVDPKAQTVTVRPLTSKGRRARVVAYGPNTANAFARYERVRRQHPKPAVSRDAFWIGKLGPLTGAGILQVLHQRCAEAGVERMHPHQLGLMAHHSPQALTDRR